jgi:hypothetical protein
MAEPDREAMYRTSRSDYRWVAWRRRSRPDHIYLMREGFSTGQVIVVDGGGVLV